MSCLTIQDVFLVVQESPEDVLMCTVSLKTGINEYNI